MKLQPQNEWSKKDVQKSLKRVQRLLKYLRKLESKLSMRLLIMNIKR